MTDTTMTLSALLGLTAEHQSTLGVARIEACKCLGQIGRKIEEADGKKVPTGFLTAAAREALTVLSQRLDIPLGEILGGVWSKYSDFLEYADPKRHPPERRSLVPLGKHKISYSRTSPVEVLLGSTKLGSIDFAATLVFIIKGATVTVQRGRFMGMRSGSVTFEAKLECEKKEVFKRTSKDYPLPGEISFGDGFPIIPAGNQLYSALQPTASLRPPAPLTAPGVFTPPPQSA